MEKWKKLGDDRENIVVGKVVLKHGKVGGKRNFSTSFNKRIKNSQSFTMENRKVLDRFFHEFSTKIE